MEKMRELTDEEVVVDIEPYVLVEGQVTIVDGEGDGFYRLEVIGRKGDRYQVMVVRKDGDLYQICELCNGERLMHSLKRPLKAVCWKSRSGRNPRTIKNWMLWNMEVAWASEEKLDTPCWIWTGSRLWNGYGMMRVRGVQRAVHRVSASLWLGFDMDSSKWVCHECNVRACINPEHLFIGTAKDNMSHAGKTGRMPRGSRHHMAKLDENQVLEIRRRLGKGEVIKAVAREFGVTVNHIYSIRDRRTWKWLKTDDFGEESGP